ncbi:MAG: Crp/Fnr family transcriptional regulator [Acidobacteria bacterium]|nr:Crp/Fnr family transcriptional regulator [Acidobacteriota bacterium]
MAASYLDAPASLHALQERFPAQQFSRRTRLHSAGEKATHVYLVESGTTKISKISYTRQPFLSLVHSGEFLGEMLHSSGEIWSTSAETATVTKLHKFPARDFRRSMARDAKLMDWVVEQLRQRVKRIERQLELMQSCRLEQRLLLTLADLAERANGSGKGGRVEIPLTQGEMASMVGSTRETTSTILNLFERKGWIELRRGAVQVVSAEMLRSVAE